VNKKTITKSKFIFALMVAAMGIVAFAEVSRAIPSISSITINSATLILVNDADGNGYANIGDTISVAANISNTDGGCGTAGTTVKVDMRKYVNDVWPTTIPCASDNGGVNDIFTKDFLIGDASSFSFEVGPNDAASALTINTSDNNEATGPSSSTNNLGDGVIDTTTVNGVDNKVPNVTLIEADPTVIREGDDGQGVFMVNVEFNEDMDQSATPTLTFSPDVVESGTLTFNTEDTEWNDTDVYTAFYDVTDLNEIRSDVLINVADAKDVAGNTMAPGSQDSAFDVNMTTPEISGISAGPSSSDRTSFESGTPFNYADTGSDDQISYGWRDDSTSGSNKYYYVKNSNYGNAFNNFGLKAWWSLNEGSGTTAFDYSSNYHYLKGELKGGMSYTDGMLSNAGSFDGIDDTVQIPHDYDLKPLYAITISAWVKPDTGSLDQRREIYRKDDGSEGLQLFSFQDSSFHDCSGGGGTGGCISFGLNIGGEYSELDVNIDAADWENKWSLVTATYQGSVRKIYKDGVEIGSEDISGDIGRSGSNDLFIGSYNGSDEFFKGLIDEVKLYNRALSPSEIDNEYATRVTSDTFIDDIMVPDGTSYMHVIPVNGVATWGIERSFEAVYNNSTYTVTFDKNGGNTDANPSSISGVSYGDTVTLPTEPTYDGYIFEGWNTQSDGGGTGFDGTTQVKDDLTFYAQWTPVSSDLSAPTATPPGGSYAYSQLVTINIPSGAEEVYYTDNGDNPDDIDGTLVKGPIPVSLKGGGSVTLKAIAYKQGTESPIMEEVYTYDADATGSAEEQMVGGYVDGVISVEGNDPTDTEMIIFNTGFTLRDGDATAYFPAGTEITQTGGGNIDLSKMTLEDVTVDLGVAGAVKLGLPSIRLSFSEPVTITIPVGDSYNGQTLTVYFQNAGETTWTAQTTCLVENGYCVFKTDHATTFKAGNKTSKSSDDEDDEGEKAKVDSWTASMAADLSSCPLKLKLEIKGHDFDDDAEVKIGSQEASSVDVKSSQKLTAKFCLAKILNVKTSSQRYIRVINPDADADRSEKKIDIKNINGTLSGNNFDSGTPEGVKNIQNALVKLGYLDSQFVTGFYGPLTTEAVKKFQEKNGLPPTGIFGPLTKAKLTEITK
jgi:uncharacterized repeat protein (TIGR02543 family)